MELTHDITDDAGTLDGPAVGVKLKLVVHAIENAPLHRLEAVAHIGQSPRRNNREGICQIAASRLFDDGRWVNRFRHYTKTPAAKKEL